MPGELATLKAHKADAVERVLIQGDLSKLDTEQRVEYYTRLCESVGLNPLTQPFAYMTLQGKLTLYAKRDATDQLRAIHGVSVTESADTEREGVFIVTTKVQDKTGRTDIARGAVNIDGLKGEMLANAMMKAETKAKRRATLSICGLGLLDELEVETIPGATLPAESPAPEAADEPPLVSRAPGKVVNPATGHKIDPNSAAQQKADGTWERVEMKIRSFDDISALTEWWDRPKTKEAISNLAHGLQLGAEHVYEEQQEFLAERLKAELDAQRNAERP